MKKHSWGPIDPPHP